MVDWKNIQNMQNMQNMQNIQNASRARPQLRRKSLAL